ncbi:hypothetical protein [Proteus alimentorum]|uniref:hypothetical protein n=1 Tax=Proteus alimentorum TaxID=1973495 RepID=UPI0019821C7E|nr:hypothetical protein [Proteus alimentorum]
MLTSKLISYFKSKGWWIDTPSSEYHDALLSINIDIDSDFVPFYLHVEDCPTFLGRNREIYQYTQASPRASCVLLHSVALTVVGFVV